MPYINIKQAVWNQYYVPDDIELPEFTKSDDIWEFIMQNGLDSKPIEYEFLEPFMNGDYSTIEVVDDDYEIIYQNGKSS